MVIINPEDKSKTKIDSIIDAVYRINNGFCYKIDENNVREVIRAFKEPDNIFKRFKGVYMFIYNKETQHFLGEIKKIVGADKIRVVVEEDLPIDKKYTTYSREADIAVILFSTLGLFPESYTDDRKLIFYLKEIIQKQHPLRNLFINFVRDFRLKPDISYLLTIAVEDFIIKNKITSKNSEALEFFLDDILDLYEIQNKENVKETIINTINSNNKQLRNFIKSNSFN